MASRGKSHDSGSIGTLMVGFRPNAMSWRTRRMPFADRGVVALYHRLTTATSAVHQKTLYYYCAIQQTIE